MHVVVRTRDVYIKIEGLIPSALLEVLRKEYGPWLIARVQGMVDVTDVLNAPLYSRDPVELSAGDYLRIFRQDKWLTQKQLGQMLGGVSPQNVCNMEGGRRPISRKMISRLAELFGVSAEKFLA